MTASQILPKEVVHFVALPKLVEGLQGVDLLGSVAGEVYWDVIVLVEVDANVLSLRPKEGTLCVLFFFLHSIDLN